MLKTFGMVTAAALLASVTAFAQNTPSSSSSTSDQASAPAAAPAEDQSNTENTEKTTHHRHHHHMSGSHMATGSKATDWNADKLNACMSNATPTAQQEQCLKSAAGTGNG